MNVLIWIIVIVVMIFLIDRLGRRPTRHNLQGLDELVRFIEGLVTQAKDGTILIVKHKKTKRFIQFVKESNHGKSMRIHYGFPDASWSRPFFPKIIANFNKERIPYQIIKTNDDSVRRFITVDHIENIEVIIRIAKLSFEAMNLLPSDQYYAYYEGELDLALLKRNKRRG